jgi:hypothetical protein
MRAWAAAFLLPTLLLGLPQNGAVTGRVRDQADKPLASVRVALAELDENGRPLKDPVYIAIGRTDNDGRFRLENVPRGRYALIAGAVANPTYYPGSAKPEDARIIAIDPAAALADLEFRLVTALQPVQTTPISVVGNGLRSTHGVPIREVPGKLVLENGAQVPSSIADIFVITMTGSAGKIQTTLEYSSGLFYLAESKLDPDTKKLDMTTGVGVRPDRSFNFSLPDGDYTATVSRKPGAAPAYYVKSIRLGSADLFKTATRLPASGSDAVVITLAPCAASIVGC